MSAFFLITFIAGLLLAVRIMFFGAERRRMRTADAMPLRRSEPAISAFLLMFGVAGYLLTRPGRLAPATGMGMALVLGALWAALVTRLAIATARVQPEHDPDDPRYVLQGHVAMVTAAIPAEGAGAIAYGEGDEHRSLPARSIDGQAIEEGVEVCIERIDDGVAFVELWALVEARL
jgi:membrane protein implicated in regulation of membrane protease activity